jgi:hypothetical protein
MTTADPTHTTELMLRLTLEKAGLRLRRSGVAFELLHGNQVLFQGDAFGEAPSLEDVADFVRRAIVRL